MKRIHEHLVARQRWYASWHDHPGHRAVHFLVFLAIALIVYSMLLNEIDEYAAFASEPNPQARKQVQLNLGELNTQLLQETKKYHLAPQGEVMNRLLSLSQVASKRQDILRAKMQAGEKGLVVYLLPKDIVKHIPVNLENLIEQGITVSGTLKTRIIDPLIEHNEAFLEYTLIDDADGTSYPIYFDSTEKKFYKNGSKLKVKGVRVGNAILADDSGSANVQVVSEPTVSTMTGTRSLLAILMNFSNNTSQPFTPQDWYNRMFVNSDGLNGNFSISSYGKLKFAGQVAGWYTISSTNSTCNPDAWAIQARDAASRAGYNLSSYQHIMYVFPATSACNFGGTAYMPGNESWINGTLAAYGTPAHEVGHNLGVHHNNLLSCGSQQIGGTCTNTEYAEYHSKMGSANNYLYNAPNRYFFGWIPSAQVTSVTGSGTYTLSVLENNDSGIKALRINKPDTSEYYFISYRQPVSLDSPLNSGITQGVNVNVWNGYSSTQTKLLLMQPSAGNPGGVGLVDGNSFTDSANGITITQLSHSTTEAVVQVTKNAPACVRANPSVSISPVSASGIAGQQLTYTVTVKNNNSSTCDPEAFALSQNVPLGWMASFSASSLTINSGVTGSVSFQVLSPSGTLDGSYSFSISATNTVSGQSGSSSAAYLVYTPVVDTQAPTVAISSPLNGSKVGSNVTVSVSGNDNIGVTSMEIYIDGSLVKASATRTASYKWNTRKVTSGAHTITTKAYDAAGNVGQLTITVYK